MEKSLVGEKGFNVIKETSEYIALINIIEYICYNYQLRKFAPLGGWDYLNRLTATQQPDDVMKSDHYNKFKTVVEVYKASGINFSVMCSANVDMFIKTLHVSGEISKEGTYKDRIYFFSIYTKEN